MVKAPISSISPSQKPTRLTTATVFQQHHYSSPGSNSSNKKILQSHMATDSPGTTELLTTLPVVASCGPGTSSGTLVVTSMAVNVTGASAVTVPPIVVAMSPTSLATNAPGVLTKQGKISSNAQRNSATPLVYHALPIQIPATAATAQTAVGTWPLVEPVFHFGPGFEPRQITPIHSANASQNNSEHVVLFHVSPGVSVTFQIGGGKHEVVRGK